MVMLGLGFPSGLVVKKKKSVCQCRRHRFDPWVRRSPWRRKWQPTPVFLPGESHGRGSLVSYSVWVTKSQIWLSMHTCVCIHIHTHMLELLVHACTCTHTHTAGLLRWLVVIPLVEKNEHICISFITLVHTRNWLQISLFYVQGFHCN